MPARIYQQSKPAGQSGLAGTRKWVFEYGQGAPRKQDALMGWTGSADTRSQLRLLFDSREAAELTPSMSRLLMRLSSQPSGTVVPRFMPITSATTGSRTGRTEF